MPRGGICKGACALASGMVLQGTRATAVLYRVKGSMRRTRRHSLSLLNVTMPISADKKMGPTGQPCPVWHEPLEEEDDDRLPGCQLQMQCLVTLVHALCMRTDIKRLTRLTLYPDKNHSTSALMAWGGGMSH